MIVPRGIVAENMPCYSVIDMILPCDHMSQVCHCHMQLTPHLAWIKKLQAGYTIPKDKWYLCCKDFTLVEASPNDPEAELLASTPVASPDFAAASHKQTKFMLHLSQEGSSLELIAEMDAETRRLHLRYMSAHLQTQTEYLLHVEFLNDAIQYQSILKS